MEKNYICKSCGGEFPTTKFYRNEKLLRGYSHECRTCMYLKQKTNSSWTREDWNKYHQNRRNEKKQKLIDLMGGCCIRCKQQFPICVYDMHHINPELKDFGLSTVLDHSWDRIETESKKCVLLCSNCHRIVHQTGEELKI